VSKLRQSSVTYSNFKPTKPTVTDKVHPPRVGHVQEIRNLYQNYVHGGWICVLDLCARYFTIVGLSGITLPI